MILLLFVTFSGILLSLIYGWILEFIAIKFLGLSDDHNLHFSITILLGVALLAGLLGVWSFYRGVGTRAVVFFLLLTIPLFIWIRKYVLIRLRAIYKQVQALHILSWLVFSVFLIYSFYLAIIIPPHYDTGLYHAQAIHWIESYHVVPGLANLHVRLGFVSNVFLLAAFWGFSGFGWYSYQVPGLIIFLCLIIYILHLMERLRKELMFSALTALGALICLPLINVMWWFASPTTDMPVVLISWVVFFLAMERGEMGRIQQMDLHIVAIIVLSFFDVTIKLSSLTILMMPVCLLWRVRASFSFKQFLALALLISFVFLSWIARNIALTGYLFFPFVQLDIFRFDWKVPPDLVRQLAVIITSWARVPNQDPNLVLSMPLSQWLPIWYRALPTNDSALLIGIVIGLALLLILIVINRQTLRQIRTYGMVYTVCTIGVFFWFIQAPSPRFGYGFLVILFLILYIPFVVLFLESIKSSRPWFILIVQSILVISILVLIVRLPQKFWVHYTFSVKPYPQIDTKSFSLGNQTLYLPVSGDQCWYDAFPCAPWKVTGLKLRGPDLVDGFYISQQ